MKAIVLAAGYATRMYPLTKDQPKPLLTLGNRTILDYIVSDIAAIDAIDRLYVVTNAKFADHFQRWQQTALHRELYSNLDIAVINDGTSRNDNRLGAIADIQYVIDHTGIHDDTLVLAGDNVFTFSFLEIYNYFMQKDADVVAVKSFDDMNKLRRSGIVEFDGQHRIIGFEEKPDNPRSTYVAPAFYIFKKETLVFIKRYLKQNNKSDAPGYFVSWLIGQRPLYAFEIQTPYHDIGTLEAYEKVCQRYSQQQQ